MDKIKPIENPPTFDRNTICIGYDNDVPVYVPRNSPEGIAQIIRDGEAIERYSNSLIERRNHERNR